MIHDVYAPEHDTGALAETSAGLGQDLAARAVSALAALDPSARPSERDRRSIAESAATFVVLCRTATPDQYVAWVRNQEREPSSYLLDTPDHTASYWRTCTAWAREAPIDASGVRARARWVRGQEMPLAIEETGLGGTVRPLVGGGFLGAQGHGRSAYEVLIPMTVPTAQGDRVDATMGVTVVNDGPSGAWRVYGLSVYGPPRGTIVVLTPL